MTELWLDPARALTGARDLSAAGDDLAELRFTAGQPWGATFERTYRPLEQQIFEIMARLAEEIQDLGEAVAASVRDNLESDEQASVRVSRALQ